MSEPPDEKAELDRICAQHTAFKGFADLLAASKDHLYIPSIRLDLMGDDGLVLAEAFNRRAAQPAYVTQKDKVYWETVLPEEVSRRARAVKAQRTSGIVPA